MLAIAIAIAGLMIAGSMSTAVQVKTTEEITFFVNKNPTVEIAELEIAQIKEEKQIVIQTKEKAVPVFTGFHPAVASDGLGYVVMGFEDESPNVWFTASDDGGQTWATEAYGWAIDPEPELPDLDYCGDGRFIGGMVPNYLASDGSELYKVEITDPMDFTPETGGYGCPFWKWYDLSDPTVHYYDFISIAVAGYIAEDPAENEWGFGGHSIVGTYRDDDPYELLEDIPMFSYQFDDTGYAWIYRWDGLFGCEDTAHDIDPENLYSYAAWNFDNEGDLDIYVSVIDFGTWEPYPPSYQIHPEVTDLSIEATGNDNYIDISALNDNIIIVSERDGDIVAYYSSDGMGSVEESAIQTGADNPRIVHTGDDEATCTFIMGEQVYYSTTEDGGEIWSTPELIDEPENDYVPEEYKASDVCGFGASWMNEDDGYAYFAQLIEGSAPEAPTITGETNGDAGTAYEYTFTATDPDGDDIAEFLIDWGDETQDTLAGPSPAKMSHTYSAGGDFIITARAKDVNGLVGPEGSLPVTMPRSRTIDLPILKFLQNYPILFKIVQHLLGL